MILPQRDVFSSELETGLEKRLFRKKEVISVMENAVIFALLVFLGCSDVGEQYVAPPPDIPLNQLLAFPETTIVSGRTLYLTTSMYRDFMPVSPPDGKPLGGGVYITAMDTSALNGVVSSDAIWIVFGQEIWKSWLKDVPGSSQKNQLRKYFFNGPKWGPGVTVDVIVRLNDNQGNVYFFARIKTINRKNRLK